MAGPEYQFPWPLFLIYGMIALMMLEAAGPLPGKQEPIKLNH